jgi:hypothetical protein
MSREWKGMCPEEQDVNRKVMVRGDWHESSQKKKIVTSIEA